MTPSDQQSGINLTVVSIKCDMVLTFLSGDTMRVQRYRSIIPESIYVQSESLGLEQEFLNCQLLHLLWFQKSTHNSLWCISIPPCTCYMICKFIFRHWKLISSKDWNIYFHCFCTIPMFQYFLGILGKNTWTCVHPKLTNTQLLFKQACTKENMKRKWEKLLASHSNFNIWFGNLQIFFTTR